VGESTPFPRGGRGYPSPDRLSFPGPSLVADAIILPRNSAGAAGKEGGRTGEGGDSQGAQLARAPVAPHSIARARRDEEVAPAGAGAADFVTMNRTEGACGEGQLQGENASTQASIEP
jgi:hypothetical protein